MVIDGPILKTGHRMCYTSFTFITKTCMQDHSKHVGTCIIALDQLHSAVIGVTFVFKQGFDVDKRGVPWSYSQRPVDEITVS